MTTAKRRQRPYLTRWIDPVDAASHFAAATAAARFAQAEPQLTAQMRNRIYNAVMWYVTEISGKYKTRYRSRGVLELEKHGEISKWWSQLRHEHVVTRGSFVTRLRDGEDPAVVLADAVACVVTKEEHEQLKPFDKSNNGWDRYLAAKIDVFDMSIDPPQPLIIGGHFAAGASS